MLRARLRALAAARDAILEGEDDREVRWLTETCEGGKVILAAKVVPFGEASGRRGLSLT